MGAFLVMFTERPVRVFHYICYTGLKTVLHLITEAVGMRRLHSRRDFTHNCISEWTAFLPTIAIATVITVVYVACRGHRIYRSSSESSSDVCERVGWGHSVSSVDYPVCIRFAQAFAGSPDAEPDYFYYYHCWKRSFKRLIGLAQTAHARECVHLSEFPCVCACVWPIQRKHKKSLCLSAIPTFVPSRKVQLRVSIAVYNLALTIGS